MYMVTFSNLPEIDIYQTLKELSAKGYIQTRRRGDTGIGFTLESLLGIIENNSGKPDFTHKGVPFELKSHRAGASSNITLITKTPYWDPMSQWDIITKYGYPDAEGRSALKVTMKMYEFNSQGLGIELNNNRLDIIHQKDGVIAFFLIDEVIQRVRTKLYENLLLVLAETKKIEGVECFHFNKATLLRKLSVNTFKRLLSDGLMVFEFRMHIRGMDEGKGDHSVRDHGPGFRLNQRHINKLYEYQEEVISTRTQSTLF